MIKYLDLFINHKPLTENEIPFVYAQSKQVQHKAGLIGYLTATFGDTEDDFYFNWFDVNASLKTDTFRQELNDAVDTLRKSGKDSKCLMHSLGSDYNELCISNDHSDYAVRRDTKNYTFMMRMRPVKRDCCIYCYLKDKLNNYFNPPESFEVKI